MSKINLKNVVWKEDKYYVSWNLNTGISSFGNTKKQALKDLQEALDLYFKDIPFPRATKVERPAIIASELQYA